MNFKYLTKFVYFNLVRINWAGNNLRNYEMMFEEYERNY